VFADKIWNLRRQGHLETMITDAPRHGVLGVREQAGAGGGYAPGIRRTSGSRDPNEGRGAIRKESARDNLIGIPTVLEMNAADFDSAQQDACEGIGAGDGANNLQAVQGAVASHEANMSALDSAADCKTLNEPEVHAGSSEAGA
jgi:hypothetical protein